MATRTYIPLIPSDSAGPLGVLNLPRLWQKVLLKSLGKLDDGYYDINIGSDRMICEALNLDPRAVRSFITKTKPTYQQFEEWVMMQPGVKLGRPVIDMSNRAILGRNYNDDVRKNILEATGYADDGFVGHSAVELKKLNDWDLFHKEVLEIEATPDVPTAENTRGGGAPDSD